MKPDTSFIPLHVITDKGKTPIGIQVRQGAGCVNCVHKKKRQIALGEEEKKGVPASEPKEGFNGEFKRALCFIPLDLISQEGVATLFNEGSLTNQALAKHIEDKCRQPNYAMRGNEAIMNNTPSGL